MEIVPMSTRLSYGAEDDLSTTVASFVTTQGTCRLPPRYRPQIGMLASPATLADGQWPVMSADMASVEAILAAGGEVRFIPTRLPSRDEDAIEMVLQAVLPFDGLLFAGSQSDVDPRLYGQLPHPRTVAPDPLLDWWTMLMALVARETLTPLLGICGGAERLNVALGGTLHQHIEGHQADEIKANNWTLHTLHLDAEKLARCVRGAHLCASDDQASTGADDHRIYCLHHQAPDVLAPAFTTWGWSDGIAEGFGYIGPMPWYALATMFHAEAGAACQEPLACSLFHSFLAAGRAYAASLRDALKSVRMRDRILRRLYAEALVQRLLHGPLPS